MRQASADDCEVVALWCRQCLVGGGQDKTVRRLCSLIGPRSTQGAGVVSAVAGEPRWCWLLPHRRLDITLSAGDSLKTENG
jgi:hypothetical protein